MTLPPDILEVLNTLQELGHAAYAVGGCVRDLLCGAVPQDYDIATSATPDETAAALRAIDTSGARYGTVRVKTGSGRVAEVTTFRSEGGYQDGRRPLAVAWEADIEKDLGRRDFTIGAMALSADGRLVDPYGGRADLEKRVIRAVGDPHARFNEDALRMLRAIRFAAYGYDIEPRTWRALLDCAHLAARLAPERTAGEVARALASACPEKAALMLQAGLLERYTTCTSLADASALRTLPPDCRMQAFLFAITSGEAALCGIEGGGCGQGGVYAACARPPAPTAALAAALRLPSQTVQDCGALDQHALPHDAAGWKRLFCRLGDARTLRFAASRLDGGAALAAAKAVIASGEPRNLSMLRVSGADYAARGLKGKQIGEALMRAFEEEITA